MFSKKTPKKPVDLLNDINNVETTYEKPQPLKKTKLNSGIAVSKNSEQINYDLLKDQKYQASYTLADENKNRHVVEVEKKPEFQYSKNPVVQTIQRLRSMKTLADIDPKNPLPKNSVIPNPNSKDKIIRKPTNVKFSCRFDYNPSLCKDYHDTGYCTFGDSCIYIHDRGDYKSGWEIEKEWEEEQKKKAQQKPEDLEQEELDQLLEQYPMPEMCPICKEDFKEPVVSQCDHFFCSKCALNEFRNSKKCFICDKQIQGSFANATKELQKLQQKREQIISDFQKNRKRNIETNKQPNKQESIPIEKNIFSLKEEEQPVLVAANLTDDIEDLKREYEKTIQKQAFKKIQRCESDWLL